MGSGVGFDIGCFVMGVVGPLSLVSPQLQTVEYLQRKLLFQFHDPTTNSAFTSIANATNKFVP